LLWLELATVVWLTLALTTWFAAWPAWLPPTLPVAALLVTLVVRWRSARPAWPAVESLACLAVAVTYRLPVLVHPWGWVNKDGFYSAMVTLHLLQGARPGPAFLEGVNYQGTLKPHLSALLSLLTGFQDLSLLTTAASLVFALVFVLASMALARRVGGRGAALVTGLYLALGPKFLTTMSLNSQGQYVEILALGGLAVALLARVLDRGSGGAQARVPYFGIGLLLGAALWQQPAAACYVGVVGLALVARRSTWRDPWTLLVPLGLVVGLLPALLWNLQHDWGSSEIIGRNVTTLGETIRGLPRHVVRTLTISLPILTGLSPGHPWRGTPGLAGVVASLPLLLLVGYLAQRGRAIMASVREGLPTSAVLAPLLMVMGLLAFWAVPAELLHLRPRYILPVTAAFAVLFGSVVARIWARSRAAAGLGMALVLALNVSGTAPRLRAGKGISDYYHGLVRSLEQKGIRTGYSDFSVSAPVTMFTAERIVLSSRLGPTPNYESRVHAEIVARAGPDALILPSREDPADMAALLHDLGIDFQLDTDPVPVFYGFSRRVRFEEIQGFRDTHPPR
jgi:hypothetical protein